MLTKPIASSEAPASRSSITFLAHGYTLIAAAVVCSIAVYLGLAVTMGCETSGDEARDAYYNRLVDGLLGGHTYLEKPVPAALRVAKDPYAPTVVNETRGLPFTPTSTHDLSYFRGRFYLYFSVVPAVLVFLPFRVVTGGYLSQQLASALFASGALIFLAAIMVSAWRRFFGGARGWVVASCVLAVGLVPLTPLLLQRADVYEVPASAAFFFTSAALFCVWSGAVLRSFRPRLVLALSTAAALAVACRPSEIAVLTLLIVPFIVRLWPNAARVRAVPFDWAKLLAAVVPNAVVAAALLAYNHARFDDLWEFGVRYQLNVDPARVPHFSFSNAAFNSWHYLFHFPGWTWHFPFAGPWMSAWTPPPSIVGVEHPVGLFTAAPWVLIAVGSIAVFRGWPTPVRVTAGACAWLAVANSSVLTLFFGTCSRYEIAFAPYLTLIAACVVLTVEQQSGGWSRVRTAAVRLCWVGTLVFSIGFGLLFAVRTRGDSYVKLGYRYALADQWVAAAAEFSRALQFDPDNLAALKLRAHCEVALNRNREAMGDLRTVVARDPADARAWNQLGVLASREPGRENEAVEFFKRCAKLTPRDAEAHCNVGISLLRADLRRDEAIRELRYALRLNPGLEPARHALRVAGGGAATDN